MSVKLRVCNLSNRRKGGISRPKSLQGRKGKLYKARTLHS